MSITVPPEVRTDSCTHHAHISVREARLRALEEHMLACIRRHTHAGNMRRADALVTRMMPVFDEICELMDERAACTCERWT